MFVHRQIDTLPLWGTVKTKSACQEKHISSLCNYYQWSCGFCVGKHTEGIVGNVCWGCDVSTDGKTWGIAQLLYKGGELMSVDLDFCQDTSIIDIRSDKCLMCCFLIKLNTPSNCSPERTRQFYLIIRCQTSHLILVEFESSSRVITRVDWKRNILLISDSLIICGDDGTRGEKT